MIVEDSLEARAVKLNAGDAIVYPSTTLHKVEEVTRGERLAVVGWVESWVRDPMAREILLDLDRAIEASFAADPQGEMVATLARARSNLLRIWAGR